MCKKYYGNGQGSVPIRGVTPKGKNCKFILTDNDVFYSRSEIKNGVFYSVVQYIGPAEKAAEHRYRVEMFNKERTESLAITRLARRADEALSEVRNSGNCVKLYQELYKRFANEKNELAFSLVILTVGKSLP
jgi:hypothetical protein